MDDQSVILIVGLMIAAVLAFTSGNGHSRQKTADQPKPVEQPVPKKKKALYGKQDTVLEHVKVTDVEGAAEIDLMIINPRGVFVLVNRKESGKLIGKSAQEKWKHIYVDENGKRKRDEVDNPLLKLEHDMHVLIRYLKHHGYSIGVHGYVYYANESIICHNRSIIKGESALEHKIHHARSQHLSKSYRRELAGLFSA